MKSAFEKDCIRRILLYRYEYKFFQIRPFFKSNFVNVPLNKFVTLPSRFNHFTRIRNRCIYTGRSSSIYKKFGLSRQTFREKAVSGNLPGVFKSNWLCGLIQNFLVFFKKRGTC